MNSTFSGIEVGKRSLMAHNQGMSTIGHNLSNASVDGYSRQRVQMAPFSPIYMPGLNRAETAGQLGQGVIAERVERVHDNILEGRIVSQANGQGYWEARDRYILMAEEVYNEPSEYSVRTLTDQFWEGWQELSMHPEEPAARQQVVQRGEALISGIQRRHTGLKEIRGMIDEEIGITVERINNLLNDVSGLNEQIVKIKAVGDNPNDLLDRRDLLVKELSGLVDITVDSRDPDEFLIHTGGIHLLQGKNVHPLSVESNPLNEGYSDVRWAESGDNAYFGGGKIASLVELRDQDIRREIQKLDNMTINFVDLVNENHSAGFGLNGKTGIDFFKSHPFINNIAGNYDANGDGAFDSTYLFRINGTNSLDAREQVGINGVLTLSGDGEDVRVPYFPTDTVEDVVKRINLSGSEVVARLDREGHLALKGSTAGSIENPDFVIRHVEDSGQFLVGYAGMLQESGENGAFDWGQANSVLALQGGELDYAVAPLSHPSGWIEVNSSLIDDPNSVAAGFGVNGRVAEVGDGTTASSIASLRTSEIMVGRIPDFDTYFSEVVADIGLKGETAARALDTENLIMQDLEAMRDSISGVNIDEELSEMIKFQHGYTAAARFVTAVNEMLDTIINRLGV
ncbi:MAG: flagellar hook-associated protein FlgK [Spirochaetales bacterium]|nr:flagellar hook-associated protein FlgK [Spirochaetales bacterium]